MNWRDVQHIVVRTSQFVPSLGGWKRNGAGLEFNPNVGFGMIDAAAMVEAAQAIKGKTLGPQLIEEFSPQER